MIALVRRARRVLPPTFTAPASVALLAFLASATGLRNAFVYDDRPIILLNARVHSLARWWETFGQAYWPPGWGDTNYRPLTILSFALQWALGHGSPALFHATSVALYVATSVAVLSLARTVLPPAAAWAIAALFAVHPVHVEAVGNVVGQSELVVALCSSVAVATYVRWRAHPHHAWAGSIRSPGSVLALAGLYFVACFSKETGFLLPALLLAAEYTVVNARVEPERRTGRARLRELGPLFAVCGAIGVTYLALRQRTLGGVGDDPNVVISLLNPEARLLTMLGVVPEWARLLLWPARLSADYAPPEIPVILAPATAVIPGIIILFGTALIGVAGWRTRDRLVTFGVLWLGVTLFPVSNVVVRSGVILAERTLFLPSVGALLAAGAAIAWVDARARELPLSHARAARASFGLALTAVIVLGTLKSSARQLVWRDSDTFLQQIVQDAPLNYRAHYLYGMWLFDKKRRDEGEAHVRLAIRMFPYDASPYVDLADQYRKAGLCEPARPLYGRVLRLGAFEERARLGTIACMLRAGEFDSAAAQARLGIAVHGTEVSQFRRLLAVADSAIVARRPPRGGAAAFRVRQSGNASVP